jgi:hypothetical protein
MTGGVGFSRDSSQSFKKNHDLAKIRPKSTFIKSSMNLEKVDPEALSESIDYRYKRKVFLEKNRKIFLWTIFLLILILVFLIK